MKKIQLGSTFGTVVVIEIDPNVAKATGDGKTLECFVSTEFVGAALASLGFNHFTIVSNNRIELTSYNYSFNLRPDGTSYLGKMERIPDLIAVDGSDVVYSKVLSEYAGIGSPAKTVLRTTRK